MSRALPQHPNLQQLHKQAKDILATHRAFNPDCCRVLRRLKQFQGKADMDVLAGEVSLVEVQYAMALDYGFASWNELVAAVKAGRSPLPGSDDGKRLDGLSWVPRVTTHMGCLEGCARHLGLEITPGWLFGGTGHAFVMNVGQDLCPSGPHDWNWGVDIPRLARNLGLAIAMNFIHRSQEDFPQKQQAIWDGVRRAIDQGLPAYGWHYEFFVINGYSRGGYLLSGKMEVPTDWREFGAMAAPGFVSIATVSRADPADDETTLRSALAFALQPGVLAAYDNWIGGLEGSGEISSDGAAYHAALWLECRRFAVEFLKEAVARTSDKHVGTLQEAAEHYAAVVSGLAEVSRLFAQGTRKQNVQNISDGDRRREAAQHLRRAKLAEEAGLAALRRAL